MKLQEKLLYHIWDQRHLITDLRTVSGKAVRIIYQGQYNTSNGPDFKNVMMILDGETLQGDAEIHIKTYDWIAHRHQENPSYNNTILHVVLEHKSNHDFTIREDAEKIEILELKNQIDTDIAKLFDKYSVTPPVGHSNICDLFKLTAHENLVPLLQACGWERFIRKVNRFNAELHLDGFDQLLYSGFWEALGYTNNKFSMLSISHNFKWDTLCEWRKDKLDEIILSSILLHHCGLLDKTSKLLKSEILDKIKKTLEYQNFSAEQGLFEWNLFRLRPANHPIRRIIQASSIVVSFLDKGFLNSLLDVFNNNEEMDSQKLILKISQLLHIDNDALQIEPIGKTLKLTIIGNIFLPILYLYAEKTNDTNLKKKVTLLYHTLPAFERNHIIRYMHGYLTNKQKDLFESNFICQQGLMRLYYNFCNFRLCELCLNEKQRIIQKL